MAGMAHVECGKDRRRLRAACGIMASSEEADRAWRGSLPLAVALHQFWLSWVPDVSESWTIQLPCRSGVVFLESHLLIAAREAVLHADDLELVFGDTHVDVTGPASATGGVLSIEIIIAAIGVRLRSVWRRCPAWNLPPPSGDPALFGAISRRQRRRGSVYHCRP